MPRILITSWGSFGDVYPYVGIALALKARGHRPLLAMPEFYRAVVEGLGIEFHTVARMVFPASYRNRRVARELTNLLAHDSFRARAAEVAAIVCTEGGAEAATGAIEAVLPGANR